jgi:Flp pilus assembly protein TadG
MAGKSVLKSSLARNAWASLKRRLGAYARARDGALALTFAIAMPAIAGGVAFAVDYANVTKEKSRLQAAVDAAALASARELRLSSTSLTIVDSVVQSVFKANIGVAPFAASASASTSLLNNNASVRVAASESVPTIIGSVLSSQSVVIHATATASMMGGSPICMIALNPTANKSLTADTSALLTGSGCALYSDSTAPNSLIAKGQAKITAALICSAGGAIGNTSGLTPPPMTDCPAIPDPLGARPAPTVGACDQTNLVISSGTQSLNPGVYCGGLHVASGATVTLNPGVFIMKNGPLTVDGGSTLNGTNVGVYLTGAGAILNFAAGANTINLTAPANGPLAGLLFFEDRANTAGVAHTIESDNARNLLGTIYLSRGVLSIGSNAKVADLSAYTIVIADSITLTGGPNMVLNANYGSTNIPTPDGVGAGSTFLNN